MATDKIISLVPNAYETGSGSKEAAFRTVVTVKSVSVPAGKWLLISFMDLNEGGSSVYNHMIGTRTVRAPEANGGGSVNADVFTGPTTVDIKSYHNISNGATVRVSYALIRLA